MPERFHVTDIEICSGSRAIVGVNFWNDGNLTDSPDLWFGSEEQARRFFAEAERRGWTSPQGVFMQRHAAAETIVALARTFDGDWWEGGPFWFDGRPSDVT